MTYRVRVRVRQSHLTDEDLADSLAGDAELPTDFFIRVLARALQGVNLPSTFGVCGSAHLALVTM
jgi:hypothetical protein